MALSSTCARTCWLMRCHRGVSALSGVVSSSFQYRLLRHKCDLSFCSRRRSAPFALSKVRGISSAGTMSYSTVERGCPNTLDYRAFFCGPNGVFLSPFHDIPLFANADKTECNMIVEIPRWSNAKMEIHKEEALNPIKQDVKKGKLRYVKNIFPHHGYIWNYGALPQTWEDPNKTYEETGTKGDSDPLDVCEIGSKIHKLGSVIKVKVLGTMLLIDEGETDWKIIAIDVEDPLAASLNDIDDIEKHMPGFLKATYEWFKFYKVPDGKPENTFAWDGRAKDKAFAMNIINECHQQWKGLIGANADKGEIACETTTVAGSPYLIEQSKAQEICLKNAAPGQAAPLDAEVDKWYYVIGK